MRRFSKFFLLLFIFSLFSIFFVGLFGLKTTGRTIPEETTLYSAAITINGNAALAAVNMSAGADGTKGNPYVIRDQVINGGGSICISISNTDAHFVLENCTVYGGSIGIYLTNVTNARLINNTARDNDGFISEEGVGIYLLDSSNIIVINNTIFNNWGCDYASGIGIYLASSHDNWLTGNTVCNTTGVGGGMRDIANGIIFYSSDNNNLTNNIIHSNALPGNDDYSGNGIYFYSNSDNNSLTQNTIFNNVGGSGSCSGNGILFCSNSLGNILTDNIVFNNTGSGSQSGSGIVIEDGCDDNTLISNTICNHTGAGVLLLDDCDRNYLLNNIIFSNGDFGVNVNSSTCNDTYLFRNMICHNSNGSQLESDQIGDWGTNTTLNLNLFDCGIDFDGDGLSGEDEIKLGTSVWDKDTDGDGLEDGEEVSGTYGQATDPTKTDSDGDGLSDGGELLTLGTNATNADTDGDGHSDGAEVAAGTDPLNASDYPGLTPPPDNSFLIVVILAAILGIYGAIITVAFLRKGTKVGKEPPKKSS